MRGRSCFIEKNPASCCSVTATNAKFPVHVNASMADGESFESQSARGGGIIRKYLPIGKLHKVFRGAERSSVRSIYSVYSLVLRSFRSAVQRTCDFNAASEGGLLREKRERTRPRNFLFDQTANFPRASIFYVPLPRISARGFVAANFEQWVNLVGTSSA